MVNSLAIVMILQTFAMYGAIAAVIVLACRKKKTYIWPQRQASALYIYFVLKSRGLPKNLIQHLIQVYIPPEAPPAPEYEDVVNPIEGKSIRGDMLGSTADYPSRWEQTRDPDGRIRCLVVQTNPLHLNAYTACEYCARRCNVKYCKLCTRALDKRTPGWRN
jgi:hypothetical protein